MRYFIHLGFDGSSYNGWQRQKQTTNTLQEVIEKSLSQIFKKNISIYGCGRTDAGVHASQYVIQIDLDQAPTFDLKFRLNKNLPNDIAVYEVIPVKDEQHCRYDADVRSYDYYIHLHKDPTLGKYSSFYQDLELDFDLMQKATALIANTKDFKALCKQPDLYDNTLCIITNCQLFVNTAEDRIRFTITANRFLRGMIRFCIYFILEVGKGAMTLEEFQQILNLEKECKKKTSAFPNGLFLSKIQYPNLQLSNNHHLIKMLKVGLE
ncbi:tRNA pseudouridine(38-40) synthase TruA [Flavobacteriaceae bacterium]|nr:tRNA pseudouridine(38-40) synthase TruA [Flavobacteriaceae bacterium]